MNNKFTVISLLTFVLLSGIVPAQGSDELEPFRASYSYDDTITTIDHSPDSRYIAVGLKNYRDTGSVRMWNLVDEYDLNDPSGLIETDRILVPYGDEPYEVSDVLFSPNGKYLLVSSYNYDVLDEIFLGSHLTLYDMETTNVVRSHEMTDNKIREVAFSPDGSIYASSFKMSEDPEQCTIGFWDTESGELIDTIVSNNSEITSLSFTPDGRYLVVSFNNYISPDQIIFFDMDDFSIQKVIYENSVSNIDFSADGSIFAAGSRSYGHAIVWNTSSGEEVRRFRGIKHPPTSVSLSSDGKYLSAIKYGTLVVWEVSTGQLISHVYGPGQVSDYLCIDFSENNKYLAVGTSSYDIDEYSIGIDNFSAFRRNSDLDIYDLVDMYGSKIVFIYDFEDIKEKRYMDFFWDPLFMGPTSPERRDLSLYTLIAVILMTIVVKVKLRNK